MTMIRTTVYDPVVTVDMIDASAGDIWISFGAASAALHEAPVVVALSIQTARELADKLVVEIDRAEAINAVLDSSSAARGAR